MYAFVLGSLGWVKMVSVGPCSINQIEKGGVVGKSMCLLAIDAPSKIDVIEDDLFLGFIHLVHYPILPNSVFPETYQLTNFGQTTRKYARLPPTRSGLKMVQRTFTVRLRKDEETGYYAARCVELPEAISQGKTEEEAVTNLREALELVLEEYDAEAKKEGGKLIPIIV